MDLCTPEMTRTLVSTAYSRALTDLCRRALLKVRIDEAARKTLDSAMRNGAEWIPREGRATTPDEVLNYVSRAAPDGVARWWLDRVDRALATARAHATIERARPAATERGLETMPKIS